MNKNEKPSLNMSALGTGSRRRNLRKMAKLPPLPSPNSNNNSIHSAREVFTINYKKGQAKVVPRTFFKVNRPPNFMEQKPSMRKTLNRYRANAARKTKRASRNRPGFFE